MYNDINKMLEKIIQDSPATILFILATSIFVQLATFYYCYSRIEKVETKVNSLLTVVQSHVDNQNQENMQMQMQMQQQQYENNNQPMNQEMMQDMNQNVNLDSVPEQVTSEQLVQENRIVVSDDSESSDDDSSDDEDIEEEDSDDEIEGNVKVIELPGEKNLSERFDEAINESVESINDIVKDVSLESDNRFEEEPIITNVETIATSINDEQLLSDLNESIVINNSYSEKDNSDEDDSSDDEDESSDDEGNGEDDEGNDTKIMEIQNNDVDMESLEIEEDEVTNDVQDFSKLTVSDLKKLAKERDIKGFYKMNKQTLIETLTA